MEISTFFVYLLVMAAVTYAVRAVPFIMIKDKINNPYLSAFFEYIPYAVLTAMTIPAIFSSTNETITGAAGFVVAVIVAFFERSLITVALSASGAVLLTRFILMLLC